MILGGGENLGSLRPLPPRSLLRPRLSVPCIRCLFVVQDRGRTERRITADPQRGPAGAPARQSLSLRSLQRSTRFSPLLYHCSPVTAEWAKQGATDLQRWMKRKGSRPCLAGQRLPCSHVPIVGETGGRCGVRHDAERNTAPRPLQHRASTTIADYSTAQQDSSRILKRLTMAYFKANLHFWWLLAGALSTYILGQTLDLDREPPQTQP